MAKARKAGADAPIINGSANSVATTYNTYHTPPPEQVWNNDKVYVFENIITSQDKEIKDLEQHIAYLNSMLEKARQEVKSLRTTAVKCRCRQ